ncbi:hypothetical protein BWI93_05210 [Siphonobacter sp. BAB-5385]|uniref:hypothetical protein n=1 Tax=Siphonobacter sp. BAB-5385 TaxID=1864822 RepID=UPI000B9E13EA|nr:hypothetical protein [Siphonobacter sp. BAB-5385]OZI09205.1 hypothetical protein BWI93_05210 [Siphonobacter sp. BAB-5385]
MAKKTTEAPVEPAESTEQVQPKGSLLLTLRAALAKAELLQFDYDKLVEQHAELKDKDNKREKSDEARGEVVEIVCSSGKLEYTADSIPLQTMMETLAEVLAALPANEVNTKLNNILVLL